MLAQMTYRLICEDSLLSPVSLLLPMTCTFPLGLVSTSQYEAVFASHLEHVFLFFSRCLFLILRLSVQEIIFCFLAPPYNLPSFRLSFSLQVGIILRYLMRLSLLSFTSNLSHSKCKIISVWWFILQDRRNLLHPGN